MDADLAHLLEDTALSGPDKPVLLADDVAVDWRGFEGQGRGGRRVAGGWGHRARQPRRARPRRPGRDRHRAVRRAQGGGDGAPAQPAADSRRARPHPRRFRARPADRGNRRGTGGIPRGRDRARRYRHRALYLGQHRGSQGGAAVAGGGCVRARVLARPGDGFDGGRRFPVGAAARPFARHLRLGARAAAFPAVRSRSCRASIPRPRSPRSSATG